VDRCKCQALSFSKTVEVVGKPAQQDDALNDRLEQRSGPLIILLRINVHPELLEASSRFFRNALRDTVWREAKERHFNLEASTEVLQIFGNWLHGRGAGTTFCPFPSHTCEAVGFRRKSLSRDQALRHSLLQRVPYMGAGASAHLLAHIIAEGRSYRFCARCAYSSYLLHLVFPGLMGHNIALVSLDQGEDVRETILVHYLIR